MIARLTLFCLLVSALGCSDPPESQETECGMISTEILRGQPCDDSGHCPPLQCFIQMCVETRCLGVAIPDGHSCLFDDGTCEGGLCL